MHLKPRGKGPCGEARRFLLYWEMPGWKLGVPKIVEKTDSL